MANHPQVREILPELGVHVPADTWFVGGYHDTCNDDVIFFDEDAIPASHRDDFARISRSLDHARAANALGHAQHVHGMRAGGQQFQRNSSNHNFVAGR